MEICPWDGCGIQFAVPEVFKAERQLDHIQFFCPNGHPNYFAAETAQDRLIERCEKLTEQLNGSREASAIYRLQAEVFKTAHRRERARASGYKGAWRKARKEAAR